MSKFIYFVCVFSVYTILNGQIDSSKVKDPSLAWKLGLIPGLGQIYNEKYIKGAGFLIAEYMAYQQFSNFDKVGKIKKRNTYSWWIVGLYVLGVLDSYVDAQLSTFPNDSLVIKNGLEE